MTPTDPDDMHSVATTLIAIADPAPREGVTYAEQHKALEAELKQRLERIARGDVRDLETILASQVELLNQMFIRSARNYSQNPALEHTQAALKSQSYCRQAIQALSDLKVTKQKFTQTDFPASKLNKRSSPYASMDGGNTRAAAQADACIASMDEEFWSKNT